MVNMRAAAVGRTTAQATLAVASGKKSKRKSTSHGLRWKTLNTFVDITAASLPQSDALVWLVLFRDTQGNVATTAQSYTRMAGTRAVVDL